MKPWKVIEDIDTQLYKEEVMKLRRKRKGKKK
jgi:hypothetical protein